MRTSSVEEVRQIRKGSQTKSELSSKLLVWATKVQNSCEILRDNIKHASKISFPRVRKAKVFIAKLQSIIGQRLLLWCKFPGTSRSTECKVRGSRRQWQELAIGHCGMYGLSEFQGDMDRTSVTYITYRMADGK